MGHPVVTVDVGYVMHHPKIMSISMMSQYLDKMHHDDDKLTTECKLKLVHF